MHSQVEVYMKLSLKLLMQTFLFLRAIRERITLGKLLVHVNKLLPTPFLLVYVQDVFTRRISVRFFFGIRKDMRS